jgi:hypothetical protein
MSQYGMSQQSSTDYLAQHKQQKMQKNTYPKAKSTKKKDKLGDLGMDRR